jgi:uncharacterized membrane protein YkoI
VSPAPSTLVLAILIAVLAAPYAPAAGPQAATGRLLLAQSSPAVSADQAAELVRARSGGRILGVRLESGERGPVYRVKVLLDGGRVRIYRVDANDGRILE